MWDVGTPVAVVGEDFIGAWQLSGGEESRSGAINHRLDGRALKVTGRLQVLDGTVTAVRVGVETQDAGRTATALTVYDVPLPALDTWTDIEAWIAPPADQVWGRPYLAVEGVGDVQFGRVHVLRSPTGQTDTADLQVGAASAVQWDEDLGGAVTIPSRGSPSGHIEIKRWDFEVERDDSKFIVMVTFDYVSSNNNDSHCWIKIGQDAPVWATSGSAEMTNADHAFVVQGYNGPLTKVFVAEGLPVGTNTLEIHAGSTGSGSHTNRADNAAMYVTDMKRAG